LNGIVIIELWVVCTDRGSKKMKKPNICYLFTVLSAMLLGGSVVSTAALPIPAELSNSSPEISQSIAQSLQYIPPPPPEQGQPKGTRGGASRGNCPAVEPALMALVPAQVDENMQQSVWAVSSSSSPTFWLYVPAYTTDSSAISIEFSLQDKEGKDLFPPQVTIASQPGIIEFSLPTTLEAGQQYHWYFVVHCGASAQDFVDGWVEWRQPNADLQRQLSQAGDREKVALYAENGFWYDALTELARLRQTNPEDEALKADWESLLDSIGLGTLATEAIVR
jgi:Domain of Unknown Function (DUF928)